MGEQDQNLPPFLKKGKNKIPASNDRGSKLGIEVAQLYLDKLFLEGELAEQEREAREGRQEVRNLQMRTGNLQSILEQSAEYNGLLLKGVRGFGTELNDAYGMLAEANGQLANVPERLSRAWDRGYIARAKEEAVRRIENRRREKDNRIDKWAVNLVRGKVTSLIRNVGTLLTGK